MNRILIYLTLALSILAIAAPAASAASRASCYGPGLYGNTTADGTVLTRSTVGVAHRTLPLGTTLRISVAGVRGRSVRVRVIDRGPFTRNASGAYDRTWDVTERLAQRLGYSSCRSWGVRRVLTWRVR